jgi:hypothetical protein
MCFPPSAQVRFYQVGEEELEELREKFRNGQLDISIEHKTFSMAEYNTMVAGEAASGGWMAGATQTGVTTHVPFGCTPKCLPNTHALATHSSTIDISGQDCADMQCGTGCSSSCLCCPCITYGFVCLHCKHQQKSTRCQHRTAC